LVHEFWVGNMLRQYFAANKPAGETNSEFFSAGLSRHIWGLHQDIAMSRIQCPDYLAKYGPQEPINSGGYLIVPEVPTVEEWSAQEKARLAKQADEQE